MPCYRIHRIKQAPGEAFRCAAHTGGVAVLKPKDYGEVSDEVEAATPYALWQVLRGEGRALQPGDVLEAADGLLIAKYIGFEPAQWVVPEPKATSAEARLSVSSQTA